MTAKDNNSFEMSAKTDFSFESVRTVDPGVLVAEAAPFTTPEAEAYYDEAERPSDTAIMVGCGLLGCILAWALFVIGDSFFPCLS